MKPKPIIIIFWAPPTLLISCANKKATSAGNPDENTWECACIGKYDTFRATLCG